MKFRATIKPALISILGTAGTGHWTTEGYPRQSVAATEVLNSLRHVTVYYGSGAFPEGRSNRVAGPMRHDMTFRVELMVSADAKANLSVLDDPESSGAQRAAAIAAALDAHARADILWDEVADLVWNVLMAPANYDLGLAKGQVTDRWISQMRKSEPQDHGSLVLLTGSMDYNVAANEIPTGAIPVLGESVDLDVSVTGDITGAEFDPALQGTEATQPGEPEE